MSAKIVTDVYQRTIIEPKMNQNLTELLPETVIKTSPSFSLMEQDDVNKIMDPLRQVWKNEALLAADHMKKPSLNLHIAILIQKALTRTKLTAAELVKAIEERQNFLSTTMENLTAWKEKATAAAQKEAIAKGKALAQAMNRKETEVSVSMSSKEIHWNKWNKALEIVDEANHSWGTAWINAQILSQAIHEMGKKVDTWVQATDHICYDSRLEMDTDIETIAVAFTAAEDKISKAMETTKKVIYFSSQPDSFL
jgi:hypothetical protein